MILPLGEILPFFHLRKNGYIERVGSRKSGYWKVI